MSQPVLEKINDQQYALSGELTMQNVSLVSEDTKPLLAEMNGDVTINLSSIVRADSAGLALLIDWLRIAQQRKVTLQFEELPEQLLQIAKVCELHTVLPINH